jgi:hypothetical protein
MSALLKISGAVLAILGLTLGVMTFLSPGKMDVYGIKLDTAAIMLVGGILAMGLAGVVDAVRGSRSPQVAETVSDVKATAPSAKPAMADNPFARKAVETTAATAAVAAGIAASASAAKAADPVGETITALEQAKADVIRSMGGMDQFSKPTATAETAAAVKPTYAASSSHAAPEAKPHEEDVTDGDDEDLFVVEEKVIRGRPARILSDDTVEAETDEGWMRFENLEHLNEYLDSVEEQNA